MVDWEVVFVGLWVGDVGVVGRVNGGVVEVVVLGGGVGVVGCGGVGERVVGEWDVVEVVEI